MQVYVLERFITKEELEENLRQSKLLLSAIGNNDAINQAVIQSVTDSVNLYQNLIEKNPDGYWLGWNGHKDKYEFQSRCINAIRRDRENGFNHSFRVVSAEVESESKTWLDYKNPRICILFSVRVLKLAQGVSA